MSLDPVLSLLDRCIAGPRSRAKLPSYCRHEQHVREAVFLGWVTYVSGMVTLTDKGRRALGGQQRWTAMRSGQPKQTAANNKMYAAQQAQPQGAPEGRPKFGHGMKQGSHLFRFVIH